MYSLLHSNLRVYPQLVYVQPSCGLLGQCMLVRWAPISRKRQASLRAKVGVEALSTFAPMTAYNRVCLLSTLRRCHVSVEARYIMAAFARIAYSAPCFSTKRSFLSIAIFRFCAVFLVLLLCWPLLKTKLVNISPFCEIASLKSCSLVEM